MEFFVLPTEVKHAPAEGCETGYLWTDKWDDWFTYSTMYYFTYFDRAGRNLSTTLRHRRFLFTDSFLLLWKWRVG